MIGKILYQIGNALFGVFGSIHDALISPDQPATLTTDQLAPEGVGPETPVMVGSFKNTVSYYIGGTFVVTILLTLLVCRLFPKLGAKMAKKKPVRRRRRSTTTKRRTYKRRK